MISCAAWIFAASNRRAPGHAEHLPFVELSLAFGATAIRKSRRDSRSILQEDTAGLRNIFDSAGAMIFAIGLNGRILETNRTAERALGYEPYELLHLESTSQILGPGEGPRLVQELQQSSSLVSLAEPSPKQRLNALMDAVALLPTEHPRRLQGSFRRKDGSLLPVVLDVSALRDHHGFMQGIVVVAFDESHAAQIEVGGGRRGAAEQSSAADRLDEEFIATVSHELRTPLTSIRGALGLLSSGAVGVLGEKADKLLRIALTNSERLVRLVNDILDLERIQRGREPMLFRPIELSSLVEQAMEGMLPVAQAAGVHLCHDTTPVEIHGDPDRLLQVLTNLLSNAVKFSPAHSTVSVRLRTEASGVTMSVIDQGRGIPEDKLESIFGKFQQVDASDSRQKGGTGLGLAICRTIVTHHGGRIWAERNPRQGATFRVFLPYTPSSADRPESKPALNGSSAETAENR